MKKRDIAEPPQWTQLACYVRNYTPRVVSLSIPFYRLEPMPRMTDAQHRELLMRNHARTAAIRVTSRGLRKQKDSNGVGQSLFGR